MSEAPETTGTPPGVRNYTLFCLVSLVIITAILSQHSIGWWSMIPLLAGSAAAVGGWSIGPPVVIGSSAWLLVIEGATHHGAMGSSFGVNWLLSIAITAYTAGHYRLSSLRRNIFPPDPRRRVPRRLRPPGMVLPPVEQPRPPDLPEAGEPAKLALVVFVCAGLATLVLEVLGAGIPPLGMPRAEWAALVLVWLSAAAIILGAIVLAVVRIYRQRPEEAMMYLQDQLWRETRREQSRTNRWLVWARLVYERRARRAARKESRS
jgi:hypothetical protein